MAQVKFKRIESSNDINNVVISDGQLIYTKDGKQYIDYETQRKQINGSTTLWENSSAISEFSSQNITLSDSNWQKADIVFQLSTTDTIYLVQTIYKDINSSYQLIGIDTTGTNLMVRTLSITDTTTISIADCYSANNVDNTKIIPVKVIGY